MAEQDSVRVSVVVPTRNEAGNVGPLIRRIIECCADLIAEIIFVDDSDDKTPDVVKRIAGTVGTPVRLIHRPAGERPGGLGGAVLAGFDAAASDHVLVMDGDLQHPPEVIPEILAALDGDRPVDVVVASRRRSGGRPANASPFRRLVTSVTSWLTKAVFPVKLAGITDPLTGFFLVDRRSLPANLQPNGFKILLEILARGRNLRVTEIGFDFGDRVSGRSKASLREGVNFVKLLLRLRSSTSNLGATRSAELRFRYDIHGVITVASEARLPELEYFATTNGFASPDIVVRIGKPGGPKRGLEFSEQLGWAGFALQLHLGDQVEIAASRLVGMSPHVLYTNVVEPVLRWEFVRRGYALVHSACVVRDGLAYLVTARTDTGKTTTALKLLQDSDLEFLSDDLCIVTPAGELLTYAKPMTMSFHTVKAVNPSALTMMEKLALQPQSRLHSRTGRRIGLGLANSAFPAATANAIVQAMIPPPKYPVDRILPGTSIASDGVPTHLFVIAKGHESKRQLYSEESMEMVLANCEDAYGFPPYDRLEEFILANRSEDLRQMEADVILKALETSPATLLQSDDYGWADQIRLEIEADSALRGEETAPDRMVPGDVEFLVDFSFESEGSESGEIDVTDDRTAGTAG